MGSLQRYEQYSNESRKGEGYAKRQRRSRADSAVPFYKRALHAAQKSWEWQGSIEPEIKEVNEFIRKHVIFSALKEGMGEVRRKAIEFIYVQLLDEPKYDPIVVRTVQHLLRIPKGSYAIMSDVLNDIIEARNKGVPFSARQKGSRSSLIEDGTEQAILIYKGVEAGLSANEITVLVNIWREKE